MTEKNEKTDLVEAMWRFWSSLRLSIWLFAMIAVTLMAGTFLPQGEDAVSAAAHWNPSVWRFLESAGAFDLYHAWWFSAVLMVLCLNLTACSLERLPPVWRRFMARTPILDASLKGSLRTVKELGLPAGSMGVPMAVMAVAQRRFGRFTEHTGPDGSVTLWSDSGRMARLSVMTVHLSVLVILLGGIVTAVGGFEGMVYITEGGESSVFYIRTQDGAVETPLPFTIKVSKFVYEQFADGRPKDYRSALEVSSGGIRKAAEIQVNTPLSFMGYGIHQSSFKPDFERSSYVVEFEQRGKAERVTGAGRVGQVIRTAVPVDAEYSLIGAEADLGGFGPAVRISRKAAEGEPLEFWLFSKYAGFDRKHRNAEWALSIKSEKPAFMTGLQITRDPGSSLVFIGCALMLLGLVAAFYMSHRQVWLKEEGGRLIVAASASKNPKAMDAAVERFMVELKKEAGCT